VLDQEPPDRDSSAADPWFEMAHDLMCELSLNGYFTRLNPSWERCLGFTRAELMARPYIEFVHPEDAEGTRSEATELAAGRKDSSDDYVNRYRTKDGGYRWLSWRFQSADGDRAFAIAHDVTESVELNAQRDLAEERLRRSEALQRTLTSNLPDTSMFLLDRDLRVVLAEGAGMKDLGWMDSDMFRGRRVEELFEVPADVLEASLANYRAVLTGERREFTFTSDGSTMAIHALPVHAENGDVESVLVVVRDTTQTERLSAQQSLEQAAYARRQAAVARLGQLALGDRDLKELMDEVVETVTATLEIRSCTVMALGPSGDTVDTLAVVGAPPGAILSGLSAGAGSQIGYLMATGVPLVVENYANETRFVFSKVLADAGVVSNMAVIIPGRDRPFGALVAHATTPRTFAAGDIDFLTAVANLLSSAINRHRDEEANRHAALHDALTGLPNRTLALDRLGIALGRRRRHGTSVAALMLDLDRFKVINDSLGHAVGDELLVVLAARLNDLIRPQDTIARLSGDEFVVVCEAAAPREVVSLAERLVDAVSHGFMLSSGEHFVTASVGIAVASAIDDTGASLLRDADAAMYRAKSRGPGRYELFDHAMREAVLSRLRTETELRAALDRGELRVHYQPIVAIATGRVLGCEALVRWEHPERGLIAPLDFIPIAEETGLIVDIGRWVLEEACRQGAEWQQRGDASLAMYVNVSGRQIANPHFPAEAAAAATRAGLAPGTLGLEVTESVLLEDVDSPVVVLDRLREHGLRLLLDDFGTGYSSLSYLKHFPLDGIKIDKTFTDGLSESPMDAAIIRAVVELCRVGGMSVIAEGVETRAQLAQLRELGCEDAQGYLFSRPLPPREMGEYLQDHAIEGRAESAHALG
jgi:diguanylate cyclase (GGDEF)-like protein/PAS domain S-box-containing protein